MRNETAQKKIAAYFQAAVFFVVLCSVCGTEGGTTDWNSRTEQRERPKRDRLIARIVDITNDFFKIEFKVFSNKK